MNPSAKQVGSVGIIGSFKQHYQDVLEALTAFREEGLYVATPMGSSILEEGINFVRFETDFPTYDDPTVQTITLHRLLRADFIYVVAPKGYVGKTTCYEIGRLLQARMPLYFSAMPSDLPITLPESHILSLDQLITMIRQHDFFPVWPFFIEGLGFFGELENEIVNGKYRKI